MAGVVKKDDLMEMFHNSPWVRKILARLPMRWLSDHLAQTQGKVYKIDVENKVVTQYNIKGGDTKYITNVVVVDGKLYTSGLRSFGIKVFDLPN